MTASQFALQSALDTLNNRTDENDIEIKRARKIMNNAISRNKTIELERHDLITNILKFKNDRR